MSGKRRKNVTDKQKLDVMKLLNQGYAVKQVASYTSLHKSTIFKIRKEAQLSDSPHYQTLRSVTLSLLDEVQQANPLAEIQGLLAHMLSPAYLREIAARHLQNRDELLIIDSLSGVGGISLGEKEVIGWVARIEKGPYFSLLREHIRHDPVYNTYKKMCCTLQELERMIVYWSEILILFVVGLLSRKEGFEVSMKKLFEDALYREQQIMIVLPAGGVLVCDLFSLAIAETPANTRLGSWEAAFKMKRAEFEHQLETSRVLYGSHLSADEVRRLGKEIWDDQRLESDSHAEQIRDALPRALETLLEFEESKRTTEIGLAKIVRQSRFPGRCEECPI